MTGDGISAHADVSRISPGFVSIKGVLLVEVVNVLTDLISNNAFPIAVVVYLFYMQQKEREMHKEESENFRQAIENNTLVVQKLTDKLEYLEEKV